MRKIILATLAVSALLSASAIAADMPVKAAPVAMFDWSGFYIGVEGGYGWGRNEHSDSLPFRSGRFNIDGGTAGATWGYNWQAGRTVYGLESDFSWADLKGSTTGTDPASGPCGGVTPRCATTLEWLATTRARIGVAENNWLLYATGGLAASDIHGHEGTAVGAGAFGDGTTWRYGWTVGAGLEAAIGSGWSAKIEYLYVDLGKGHVFTDSLGGATISQKIDLNTNVVRVGLNYKFGNPGRY